MEKRKPDALIFDMDGTLLQTEKIVVPAYERAFARLREEGLVQGEMPPATILLESLGMLLKDIWGRLLPNADEKARERIDQLLMEEQLKLLEQGAGELYPGVHSTLRRLKQAGCRLFVASNGLEHYVKATARETGIAPLFDGLYSAGEFRTKKKTELVALLLTEHRVTDAWMVGDRSSDVEAGLANNLFVVGCEYAAFGVSPEELKDAHVRIGSFEELLNLLPPQ